MHDSVSRQSSRREFLAALARAGTASAALATLPPWVRAALAQTRPPELIELSDWPEHLETSIEALGRSWLTRNDRFFVRCHFPVPQVDLAHWRLEVAGLVETPLVLTFDQVRALPASEGTYVVECAGNGRGLMRLPSTSGTQWGYGAVGNAAWGGVRLSTVLEHAGVQPEARHVWFESADRAPLPQVPRFVRSIPLEKAMSGTLLAYSMNGEPLPPGHGAPLRAIVPGWYGMASTKWLTRVRVAAEPPDNHFMDRSYHFQTESAEPQPVQEMRVKSLITRPLEGERVPSGRIRVQGFAWSGAARVRLVEVSADGGRSWRPAGFMGDNEPHAWREWATEIEVESPQRLTLFARATDSAGNAQPAEAPANLGGYGNNSIHRVVVHVRG